MTEQNIRDAFERDPEHSGFDKSRRDDGEYEYFTTNDYYQTFKAGYIAAFKVILDSENG